MSGHTTVQAGMAVGLLTLALCISPEGVGILPSASPAAAQEDAPTGGGYGCQSNDSCQGTLYKDRSNLDRWWYPICSGCHTVQAPPPTNPAAPLSPGQRKFVGDVKAFWRLHGQAQSDPALRLLLPKARLKPLPALSPEFRALVKK